MALKHSAQRIYLAHHADDQAETILAHLCRGAGLTGASGMAQETVFIRHGQRFQLVRPLLHWRRAEIDAYIREHRLTFREDSSNISRGPRRNRLRHEALPLLSQIFERDVAPILARCGQLAARDDAALWSFALHLSKEHLLPDGSLKITATLKQEPPAILSRLLRWWLVESLKLYDLGHAEIEHALTMLQPGGPAKINLPGGHHLRRKAGRLWVQRSP
jgi:tRNA(Ile)-lysidine synthase